MSSLSDISNSIKASITDKVTHPLLGSFIISWLFFNWKAVYFMLFASHDVVYRLKAVSENYSDLDLNLLFPLASSLALVFLLPMFTASYTRFIAMTKELQMRSLPELFRSHSLTLEESNSLRDFYEKEFKALKSELETITQEVTTYRTKEQSEVNNYKNKINAVFDLLSNTNIDRKIISAHLTPTEIDFLIFLEQFLHGPKEHDNLSDDASYSKLTSAELASKSFEGELITIGEIDKRANMISITRDGIEMISQLKYQALNKQYDLTSPNGANGRTGMQ
ncbi:MULTISPECIES: hypothetical protein [unclassified Pseudoalteromonas]|uniref:hypothetical protein n=1 Tax=unclassified Pseudoalteromonas TaxID=194690 RepID=UPI0025B5F870|nr:MULTISPECIES: hypothetical protein [unclassified Pseudoalteromonas]MDN3377165.1 hypothetical protein [Pseudoalteromonas sp. APC 3893]MDN3385667.1 hypothetical protein [Pseudoalteromonas sp. APC 4017]